jgi:aspartate aminotransferase-like enzyme/phosphoglycerate dehydrogenase-like enzyme
MKTVRRSPNGSRRAVVLLPVVYDDAALALFRKPAHYRNHGLLSAALLERAERAGRLDLVINAAARGALVDRAALADAVGQGWLRYLSDETPSATDPLLEYDNAAFTAHVGGSCRAPQAAVARNTHTILRRILAEMRGLTTDDADGYRVNVVNGHLLDESAGRRLQTAARDIGESGRVRVLLTDSFDVESLAFGSLASMGIEADVHDISAGPMSSAKLVDAVERLRPHVLMLRSRTRIDAAAAERLAGIGELACIIRPGVGVDNVYAGMSVLTAAGVRIVNEPFGNSRAVAEMALHFLLSGTETTLLAPGPTKFNSEVFDVAHAYDEVRIQEPGRPEAAIGRTLGRWLGARRAALTISGPGTALMEASIANLTRAGDRGLVISHGKFGDRFAEIASARGRPCEILKIEEEDWGRAVTPHDVERALMQDADRCSGTAQPPISFLCFQQNETSSGVTYHEPAIRALVRVARTYHPDMIVIADAISGALAHRLTFDALDLDALFLGSQKALAVSSGLAFAVLSDRAVKTMLTRAGFAGDFEAFCGDADAALCLERFDRLQHVHSTNLLRAIHTASRGGSDDTPSLLHLLQTERALELFEEEGGAEALAGRHSELAHLVRDGVRRLGLELMPSAPYESDSVTVAILPPGLEASAIRKAVARNTGIAIAGAQGDFWKPRMLRIGTLGFVTRADAVRCLRALGVALEAAGHKGAVRDRALATAR